MQTKDTDILIDEDKASTLTQVQDLDFFANVVANWLLKNKQVFNHILNVPSEEDMHIKVPSPNHPDKDEDGMAPITGDTREGFLHGVRWALEQLEEFPFQFVPEDADGNTVPEYAAIETATDKAQ